MTTSQLDHTRMMRLIGDEVTLYRELFFLADKQRDWLERGADTDIGTILEQIERVQTQIVESENRLRTARDGNPNEFEAWARTPRVASLLNEITDLVQRTQAVISDCIRLANTKKAEYQTELSRMEVGRMLFSTMANSSEDQPMFVDHRP
jgi:hypothetical protein